MQIHDKLVEPNADAFFEGVRNRLFVSETVDRVTTEGMSRVAKRIHDAKKTANMYDEILSVANLRE